MKKASRLAFLLPIVAGVFWGSVGTFVRYLNANEIGSMTILSSRVLVAALILLVGILCTKPSLLKIKLRDLWIFLIASLVGMLGLNACYNEAIYYLPMSLAAILLGLYPIFVMILAAFLFHERVYGPGAAGLHAGQRLDPYRWAGPMAAAGHRHRRYFGGILRVLQRDV